MSKKNILYINDENPYIICDIGAGTADICTHKKINVEENPELIEEYYVCNRTGEKLLKEAIKQGLAKSTNPRLDVSILVSGLWGCIESVLLKKSEPDYWEKGNAYTDRFIKLWINSIFVGDEK